MKKLVLGCAVVLGALFSGCSGESPSSPSPSVSRAPLTFADAHAPSSADVLDVAAADRHVAELRQMFLDMQQLQPITEHEDFDCTRVEEVRVRFSDPGFIEGPDVGLFVKFVGIPEGTKTLRIWWDYENDFDSYQDVDIGEGDRNPEREGFFDFEAVIEHRYDIRSTVSRLVRVELILEDETGNCARNRHIVVSPETFDHIVTFGGVPMCFAFAGTRGMGLWANFDPPIPAGTTYTIRARVTGTGVVAPFATFTMFGNTAGPDFVSPSQFSPPPNDFNVALTSSVPHRQLQIAATLVTFGPTPTSMAVRVVDIKIPGKTVQLAGNIFGTCP